MKRAMWLPPPWSIFQLLLSIFLKMNSLENIKRMKGRLFEGYGVYFRKGSCHPPIICIIITISLLLLLSTSFRFAPPCPPIVHWRKSSSSSNWSYFLSFLKEKFFPLYRSSSSTNHLLEQGHKGSVKTHGKQGECLYASELSMKV